MNRILLNPVHIIYELLQISKIIYVRSGVFSNYSRAETCPTYQTLQMRREWNSRDDEGNLHLKNRLKIFLLMIVKKTNKKLKFSIIFPKTEFLCFFYPWSIKWWFEFSWNTLFCWGNKFIQYFTDWDFEKWKATPYCTAWLQLDLKR